MGPQIVVGLLVDRTGFPLEIGCFEGNTAETTTLVPIITAFQSCHGMTEKSMVVAADAGMLSAANLTALDEAGLGFIVRSRAVKAPIDLASHFHWNGDAIEAHLTIVFTALAVAHCIQERSALAIADVIKQLRPLRSASISINGASQTFPPEIPEA